MGKYNKSSADFFLIPYMPQANFLNSLVTVIQAFAFRDCLPYALVKDDLHVILPEREDERTSGVGEGMNDAVVLESQFKVGAGSIPNVAFEFLMIPRIGGDVTMTHQVAEIWTVTAVVKESITASSYFNFDVIDANHDHFQYQLWFDVSGGDPAPTAEDCYDPVDGTEDGINKITTQGKRDLIEADISGAADADAVAVIIAALINGKADVGSGSVAALVTSTNAQLGCVMDAHDINSGLVITVTTQGRDKIQIDFPPDPDDIENQDYGFHYQNDNGAKDIMYEITGVTVAEHTLEVESGEGDSGSMKEDISYMTAATKESYGALTMLDKMRSYYGGDWNKKLSPFGNKFRNHGWHTCNQNQYLKLNTVELDLAWYGWKVVIENDLSHDYDGAAEYASAVNFNGRGCTITLDVQPETYELYELSRKHVIDYGGAGLAHALEVQLKSIRPGTGDAVFVQFDCDKTIILPFEIKVNADGTPEQYQHELVPAPDAAFSYIIQTYIPNYAFGLGGE